MASLLLGVPEVLRGGASRCEMKTLVVDWDNGTTGRHSAGSLTIIDMTTHTNPKDRP